MFANTCLHDCPEWYMVAVMVKEVDTHMPNNPEPEENPERVVRAVPETGDAEMPAPLRSQATRDRILVEARRLFAERGYVQTTMRAIAAAANINVSIVARYYGSKADLFAVAAQLDIQLPDLSTVPPDKRGEAIVSHFIDIREQSDESDPLIALVRSAVSHDVARQRYFDFIKRQADLAIMSVVPKERRDEVFGLVSIQLVGLAFSRYILKHPRVTALEKDVLVREIGAILQKYMAD